MSEKARPGFFPQPVPPMVRLYHPVSTDTHISTDPLHTFPDRRTSNMAAKFCLGLIVALSLISIISSMQMAGGAININPDRADVMNAANFAMQEFNQNSKSVFLFKLLKVLSAQSQVVEGINYFLDVEIGRTQCRKGSPSNAQSCNSEVAQISVCKFQVWDIPWLNKKTLVSYSCKSQ
uniref:Cystatin domain-containing protein n=1 Tax=Leptobrachium leishanense TaxID=445787 RepID=A0A8C5MNK6_9ANUR